MMSQGVEADVLAGLFSYPRLIVERGEGTYLWDVDGRRYMDFTAGIGVMALGHSSPTVAQALEKQSRTLQHVSNLFGNVHAIELASLLVKHSFAARVWFSNSGAEANEAALKFARLCGRERGRTDFIAFKRGFHGRTMGALAVTHTPAYREPFEPMVPGARFADFNDLQSVDKVLDERVCAIIVEPVQGEGGVYPGDAAFLQGLRKRCDENGIVLIFDEVQCGMGRTGRLFAHEHSGVIPDIMTLAKPLGGGLPLAATLINDAVAATLKPGHHGSTFSGGPLVCGVGRAVVQTVVKPEFLQRVNAAAQRLVAGLQRVVQNNPLFCGYRGLGLMQALVVDAQGPKPVELVKTLQQMGLLVTRAGDDALRLLPPLTVSDSEIDAAVELLVKVGR